MNSIKSRFNFILLLAIICFIVFSFKSYDQYRNMLKLSNSLEVSFKIRSLIYELKSQFYNKEVKAQLQEFRRNLVDPTRSELLSDLIAAYTSQDQRLFQIRKEKLILFEEHLTEIQKVQFQKDLKKLSFFLIMMAILPLCLFLLSSIYLNTTVFGELKKLSKRMMDFLVDRYSFQFSNPSNNEFGALQSSFNSIAQKVINNMEELKSLDRAKSEFLNIASHELRTPMTSIKGSLSLLSSGMTGELDPQAQKLIKIAETESDRLIRLINDLLDLAKIEARKLPLNKQWHSWRELASKTAEGLSAFAFNAKVQLVFEAQIDYKLNIDSDRIQQVLTNLISNAVKFSPEQTTVRIQLIETSEHLLEIQVIDQGPGISQKDQEILFQKFRQIQSSNQSSVNGTGLGLAIAKALVEEHKGEIGIRSQLGQGSCFFFTLPEWQKPTIINPESQRKLAS